METSGIYYYKISLSKENLNIFNQSFIPLSWSLAMSKVLFGLFERPLLDERERAKLEITRLLQLSSRAFFLRKC